MLGTCLAPWCLWRSGLGQNGVVRAASWDSAQTRSQGLRGLKKTVTPMGLDCHRRVLEAVREQGQQAQMPMWVR
jgi:hypothetical protein